MPDSESFRTWNMGMGLIVAIDADDAEAASASGHPVIGRLVESEPARWSWSGTGGDLASRRPGDGVRLQPAGHPRCLRRRQAQAEVVLVVVNRRTAYAADRARCRCAIRVPADGTVPGGRPDDPRRAREHYDAALAAEIADARPDLIVQAGWMHLFTSAFLDRFPGWSSTSPALPGAFPGAHAIDDAWARTRPTGSITPGSWCILFPTRVSTTGRCSPRNGCRSRPTTP